MHQERHQEPHKSNTENIWHHEWVNEKNTVLIPWGTKHPATDLLASKCIDVQMHKSVKRNRIHR